MSGNTQHPFTTYLRRLANLSGNNRSIFLPQLRSEQFIDLHYLSQLNREKSFSLIEAAIQRKKKAICSIVDSRMAWSNEASKKLRRLQRVDKLIFEERGVKDLHIGWPFVRGKFLGGNVVRCPLLLIPAELALEKDTWVVKPRDNDHITFNKFFMLSYFFHNGIAVEDSLLEETFEEVDKDSLSFRTTLYQLLQDSPIDIHFNADNYRDELIPFQPFLKKEFEDNHENGKLKLFPEAVLGIFPQAGSYLAPDYMELIKDDQTRDIETFFLNKDCSKKKAALWRQPNLCPEKELFVGHTQDAWQENIVKALKAGHSIIAKGPPGTGKSQLICNIICDAIATGKKVLVVCQKRAALEVVYERLKKLQLADFIAPVHDFKNDRKEVYAKAAKQIKYIDAYKAKNNSLNAIQMDRKFIQASNRIDQIIGELSGFKKALFDDSDCGISVKELYLRSTLSHATIDLRQEYEHFPIHNIDTFISKLNTYTHYARQFENTEYPWRQRKSFASFSAVDVQEIEKIIEEMPASVHAICRQLEGETGRPSTWEECSFLCEKKEEIVKMLSCLKNETVYTYFQFIVTSSDSETDPVWLAKMEQDILACFAEEGPEVSLSPHALIPVEQALQRSIKLQNKPLGVLRWALFSKDKIALKKVLFNNALKGNKEGLQKLQQKLSLRLSLAAGLAKLKKIPWLTALPNQLNEGALKQWFVHQQHAINAAHLFRGINNTFAFINPALMGYAAMQRRVNNIIEIVSFIPPLKTKWGIYLSAEQTNSLPGSKKKYNAAYTTIRKDFDALCEFDALKEGLSVTEKSVIEKIYSKTKTWENFEQIFMESLYLAWIDHIETKFPVLRIVSSGKLHLLEEELGKLIAAKQKISNEIMLMHAREGVTQSLKFNRLNNRITYRDLLHQLTKKRKIWPIRKVLDTFEDEIFRLLPCWMASPESVSAIFPLREIFDIVIFDEASQCFAERGIPAIYRGRQVLIAGDDKQLRPNDLYRIRWKDEEENPDTEVDSLLELAARHLKQMPLRGHYRSKSPALIDFSNRHFYDGQLTFVPHFDYHTAANPPIVYRNVGGRWKDSTNIIEAEEVIQLVVNLVRQHPTKEIGIVTFNAPQQMLIMDLLEDIFAKNNECIPPSLMVKNIENVQGDEKDIIIFSIGYAPGKTEKINMQFGSLNLEGGENRLNVAITRAREKIIVVTSIQPHQLHVDETRNKGPKLLKQYLQYAKEVSEGQFTSVLQHENKEESTHSLKHVIKSWGNKNTTKREFGDNQLPFVDVSVYINNKTSHVLLTDDELFYQSPSVKDFHFFMPHTLKNKKWSYIRLYSRNYWQDSNNFFSEIERFIS